MKTVSTMMAGLVLCASIIGTAHAYPKGTKVYASFGKGCANAYPKGTKVYASFGKGSAARTVSGYVEYEGSSTSKVDWTNCYSCSKWVSTSNLSTSWSTANETTKRVKRRGTVRKVATAAAVIGGAYLLFKALGKRR